NRSQCCTTGRNVVQRVAMLYNGSQYCTTKSQYCTTGRNVVQRKSQYCTTGRNVVQRSRNTVQRSRNTLQRILKDYGFSVKFPLLSLYDIFHLERCVLKTIIDTISLGILCF